jgi:molybdate transport system ATP-binding protein
MTIDADFRRRRGTFALAVAFRAEAPVVALFGRSGSGKTTVINALAGISSPDAGRIAIDGVTLFDSTQGIDLPPERRRIGYVFQDGLLFPHLSVRSNLYYGQALTPPAERYIDEAKVIGLLGLERLLERSTTKLSGGEKQRVAIGRALLASPRLLLLDEPLASLDAARKGEILQYIELLRDEFRVPIVYVSHSVEEVARLADHVVLLADGRSVASGPLAEVLSREEFAGAATALELGVVLDTRVVSHEPDELTVLAFAGGTLLAPSVDALIGERVRVRIRARDVAIALEAPAQLSVLNVLGARIVAVEEGRGATVTLRLAVGDEALLASVSQRSATRLALVPGKEVFALLKAVAIDRQSVGFA